MLSLHRIEIRRVENGVQILSVAGLFPNNRQSLMDAIHQIPGSHHGIYPAFNPCVFEGSLNVDFFC